MKLRAELLAEMFNLMEEYVQLSIKITQVSKDLADTTHELKNLVLKFQNTPQGKQVKWAPEGQWQITKEEKSKLLEIGEMWCRRAMRTTRMVNFRRILCRSTCSLLAGAKSGLPMGYSRDRSR